MVAEVARPIQSATKPNTILRRSRAGAVSPKMPATNSAGKPVVDRERDLMGDDREDRERRAEVCEEERQNARVLTVVAERFQPALARSASGADRSPRAEAPPRSAPTPRRDERNEHDQRCQARGRGRQRASHIQRSTTGRAGRSPAGPRPSRNASPIIAASPLGEPPCDQRPRSGSSSPRTRGRASTPVQVRAATASRSGPTGHRRLRAGKRRRA